MDNSLQIVNYADDTTIVGLISNKDETQYDIDVDQVVTSYSLNPGTHYSLPMHAESQTTYTNKKDPIDTTDSFKFLRTYISNILKWKTNTNTKQ